MARALALVAQPIRELPLGFARGALVIGCALALILAATPFPALGL